MARKRKSHTATFKAQVALAAVKGDKTVSELASLHGVHPTMIHTWKKQLLDNAEEIFQSGAKTSSAEHEALQAARRHRAATRRRLEVGLPRTARRAYDGSIYVQSGCPRPNPRKLKNGGRTENTYHCAQEEGCPLRKDLHLLWQRCTVQ